MVGRNPPWTRDELILALDLYFRVNPLHTSEKHPEVVALSQLLDHLPIHKNRPDEERFRNPNGVYMKLCNFLRLDPSYHGKGLDAGSKLDVEVWDTYASDQPRLREVANAIRADVDQLDEATSEPGLLESEDEAPEWRILLRQHKQRERNEALVRKKKQAAMNKFGCIRCEVSVRWSPKTGQLAKIGCCS